MQNNVNDFIKAIKLLEENLKERAGRGETVPSDFGDDCPVGNGFSINEIKSFNQGRFNVSVYMLDRSIRENDSVRGGDICDFVIADDKVYSRQEWDDKSRREERAIEAYEDSHEWIKLSLKKLYEIAQKEDIGNIYLRQCEDDSGYSIYDLETDKRLFNGDRYGTSDVSFMIEQKGRDGIVLSEYYNAPLITIPKEVANRCLVKPPMKNPIMKEKDIERD